MLEAKAMSIIDKTIPTSTREFFQNLGVTDTAALDSLCELLQPTCDIGTLEDLRNLVLHGCFRTADDLRNGLWHHLGDDVLTEYGEPAVNGLLGLRTFTDVPTVATALEFCGSNLQDWQRTSLAMQVGDAVPEWFFPALVILAHRSANDMGFMQAVSRALSAWNYGDEIDGPPRHVPMLLRGCWTTLRARKPERWLITYAPESY